MSDSLSMLSVVLTHSPSTVKNVFFLLPFQVQVYLSHIIIQGIIIVKCVTVSSFNRAIKNKC